MVSIVSIEKEKVNYLHFLENKLNTNGGATSLTTVFDRAFLEISYSNADALRSVLLDGIAEIITIGYKYDYFKRFMQIRDDNLLDTTLINTMSVFDNMTDKKYIIKKLNLSEEISIDGIFNFSLTELRKKWDEIIDMSVKNRLLSHDGEIKKEFLNYLIQAIPAVTHTIRVNVDNLGFTMFDVSNNPIGRMNYVRNKTVKTVEEEVLYNLICYSPKAVIFNVKYPLSKQFFELAGALFEVKPSATPDGDNSNNDNNCDNGDNNDNNSDNRCPNS